MPLSKIYSEWKLKKDSRQKSLAVLIDPDKVSEKHLSKLCSKADKKLIDYFFVGGSILMTSNFDSVINYLKLNCKIPVLIFPGNTMQISPKADGLLLLSLISGRNADLLIGKHVEVAPILRKTSLELLSTGYILVESGKTTSVSYMSNTTPIPRDKPEIALSTALAGEMLGLNNIYLEAGSGALQSVPQEMVSMISDKTDIPLIVGGGIRDFETAKEIYNAGADIIVVGTKIEEDSNFIEEISTLRIQEKISI